MRIPRSDVKLRVERDKLESVSNSFLRLEVERCAERPVELPLLDERVKEEGYVLSSLG